MNETSIFDRKSYFYPDSPTGFQITQLYHPIVEHGTLTTLLDGTERSFRINRMHIETDAGKLVHAGNKTLCDFNRCGSPLMEIVTEPDFRSKEEVNVYLEELQKIMRWSGASNADMDKGQLRCDVNISIRRPGETILNNRVELKNLNSFSAIGRAIDNEFKRQTKIVDAGGKVDQETRGWDDEKGMSTSQRSKEDAMDYRYFPEPDLPPLVITPEYIAARAISELPHDRREKYLNTYKLQSDDARILSEDRLLSDYYEQLVTLTSDPRKSCSYITSILFALFETSEEHNTLETLRFDATELARVINLTNTDELSSTSAKIVVEALFASGGTTDEIIDRLKLRQTNDTGALEAIAQKIIAANPGQVAEYQA